MDSIRKIVAADEAIRQNAAELEQKRENLEGQIASEKQKIKAEMYAKADAEIARVMAAERKSAETVWRGEKLKYDAIGDNLDELYHKNRDEWARIIADRVTKGSGV